MQMNLLFSELSTRGLSIRRWGSDLECTGDSSKITPELAGAIDQHRSELEKLLPDQQAKQAKVLADLVEWLNLAMPAGYRVDDHRDFWRQYDAELEAEIESRSLGKLETTIETLKTRIVEHFTPFHPLPKPGESVVVNPGHRASELRWEAEERTSVAWEANLSDAEGERRLCEAMTGFAHHNETDCQSEKVWIHRDGRLMCKRCSPPNDLADIQTWSTF